MSLEAAPVGRKGARRTAEGVHSAQDDATEGKSCFYVRQLTPEIRTQIEQALAKGYELYEERGWT